MLWLPSWLRKILIVILVPLPIPESIKGNLGSVEDYFWYYTSGNNNALYSPSDYINDRKDKDVKKRPSYKNSDATRFQRFTQLLITFGGIATALDYSYRLYQYIAVIIKGL